MLRSFCIKTNNKKILNYLLNCFKSNTPSNFYLSKNNFKIYENIIYHYTGENEDLFLDYISDRMQEIIIKFYESKLISNIINYNYFYFSDFEKKEINHLCTVLIEKGENAELYDRKKVIFYLCREYIQENKTVVLDGFVNFRLKEYSNILEDIVETSVNTYVVKKEYNEFINLLKIYIDSNNPSKDIVHLLYFNQESILLDNSKNVINFNYEISNAKYLSDITFSSNDYCLNTLLNILPKKFIFIC